MQCQEMVELLDRFSSMLHGDLCGGRLLHSIKCLVVVPVQEVPNKQIELPDMFFCPIQNLAQLWHILLLTRFKAYAYERPSDLSAVERFLWIDPNSWIHSVVSIVLGIGEPSPTSQQGPSYGCCQCFHPSLLRS